MKEYAMKIAALCLMALLAAAPLAAHNGEPALVAPILEGLVIDGDLSDWPAALQEHPMAQGDPAMSAPDSADFHATFKVGYSPSTQLVYLAITVRDDIHLLNYAMPWGGDLSEVYLKAAHRGGPHLDEPGGQIFQYSGLASANGQRLYRGHNTYMFRFDVTLSRTQMAYRRADNTTTYEWALEAFDYFPGQPALLEPGRLLDFDVQLFDWDQPGEEAALFSWGPYAPFPKDKVRDADSWGDLLLGHESVGHDRPIGTVAGLVTGPHGQPLPHLDLQALHQERIAGLIRTDAEGRYRLPLRPGPATLQVRPGQGFATAAKNIAINGGQTTIADFDLTATALPPVLQKTLRRYAGLQAYRDSLEVEIDGGLQTATTTFAWKALGGLHLDAVDWTSGNQFTVHHDGQQLTQYSSLFLQYVQQQAPAPAFAALTPYGRELEQALPGLRVVQQLLLAEHPGQLIRQGLTRAAHAGQTRLDGRQMTLIDLDLDIGHGSMPKASRLAEAITLRLWIDAESGAIRRATYQSNGQDFSEYYHSVDLDPVLSDDTFRFAAPLNAEPALYLGEGYDYGDIVGDPAPDFDLRDPQGNPVRLADYAGQVVLVVRFLLTDG
ncbi:MAG: DUF2092 domain-containing protein [Candidatus Latescibacteria bacterium]|nr:DUF2092 domain-containing protein [Candidatus Latescibacterota bacterium]